MRCFHGCAWLLIALFAASSLPAAEPQFGSVSPVGFQSGKETELTFSGQRLGDIKELMFFSPGFTVTAIEPKDDASFKAKVTAAPDLPPGIYALRLRTATGLSNLKTITIGRLPDEKDVEPNNSFDKPQAVPLNCTVNGSIASEDSDFFAVELKKGDRLTAEVEGLRLGNSYFDPFLAIYNDQKGELVRSDDAPLLFSDSLCSIVAPNDGKYLVLLREAAVGGGGGGYRLHIGTFPRPTAVFPPGGKPGETLTVRWIGDGGGEFSSQVTLPTDGRAEVPLFAQDDRGSSPSGNVVRVNDLAATNEVEPNNDLATATAAAAPGAFQGILQQAGDVDHFKFAAKKGQQLDVRLHGRMPFRSPLDSVLTILNAKGGGVGSNDDTGGQPDSYVRFNVPEDGEYTVVVRDQLGAGGANFVYRVEVTEVKPALTISLPERVQYVSNTLVVPKNNRMAIMVAAQRQNFAADLALEFPGLPAGMTAEALPLTNGRGDVPVIFSAAADAAPAGATPTIVGRSTDPNVAVEGKLGQRTMLIRGQNNRDVWGFSSDKMAVVGTEEIPFKIDFVVPKAPLPRNGSMDLKIVATRAADFKAPIAISLLYSPAGTSANQSAVIPEGQNEGVISITANNQAALGAWKLVALGRSAHAGANVECATQFAEVNIVESYYNLTIAKAAAEQGKESDVVVTAEVKQPFEGTAKAELLGLPNGATAQPVEFNKDATQIAFKVTVAADARPGKFTTLVCRTTQQVNGEAVTHTLGAGELRIDPPRPPKTGAPAAAPMPQPGAPPAKPLSRLEQLRQENKK